MKKQGKKTVPVKGIAWPRTPQAILEDKIHDLETFGRHSPISYQDVTTFAQANTLSFDKERMDKAWANAQRSRQGYLEGLLAKSIDIDEVEAYIAEHNLERPTFHQLQMVVGRGKHAAKRQLAAAQQDNDEMLDAVEAFRKRAPPHTETDIRLHAKKHGLTLDEERMRSLF